METNKSIKPAISRFTNILQQIHYGFYHLVQTQTVRTNSVLTFSLLAFSILTSSVLTKYILPY